MYINSISFEDDKVQNVINIFLQKVQTQKYHNSDFKNAIKVIELLPQSLALESVTWAFFQDFFNKGSDEKIKYDSCKLIGEFIKNDCYSGEYSEVVSTFKDVSKLGKELFWLFSNSFLPYNLIVFKDSSKVKNRTFAIKNDSANPFLSNLLKDFAIKNVSGSSEYQFYTNFQKSLAGRNTTEIVDFNAQTFKLQFYFFKDKRFSSTSISMLKKFYLMLLNSPQGRDILHWRDGIDKNMLQSVSFAKNYEEGFLPIPLNSFDPIPKFDKWLVMPNGAETKTTKINSFSYKPIDFSFVEDEKLKYGLKDWFWNSNVVLTARIEQAHICIKFINFVCELRNQYGIKRFSSSGKDFISVEEIFSYVQFVRGNELNSAYITAIKRFLTYLQENNLYNIEPSVFKYLFTKKTFSKNTSKDIPDEHLLKLDTKLKENSKDSYLNTLYYIIFHIAIATEFRISQIINLQLNCFIPGIKKEYYLKSNTKVSNGEEIKIPITPFTKRYLETAITFTQNVRDDCKDKDIKEHIFIHNKSAFTFKVVSVRSFSDYLKRVCSELDIETYTAQNLRDTYMTKSIEYAIKNNLSDLEVKALTGHKHISTTTNHYVANKIKDFLEATHRVVIGNLTIKGKVASETDHKQDDLVNDQCGFCDHESCIQKENNTDCLMCSGFIATIDRMPFYEEKIKMIDNDIKSTKLSTEKERLVVIKRLYLAYLNELLVLKETVG